MVQVRRKHVLVVLIVVAALVTAFLREDETAIAEQHPPVVVKEIEVPHEIELEQSAELLRASRAKEKLHN